MPVLSTTKYDSVPLNDIALDDRNPRIVSQTPLSSQSEILAYLYENEDLEAFVKKIASEGKNLGAERPYVVKKGFGHIVIEGNTRIAAYKLLTGLVKPPSDHAGRCPIFRMRRKRIYRTSTAASLQIATRLCQSWQALTLVQAISPSGDTSVAARQCLAQPAGQDRCRCCRRHAAFARIWFDAGCPAVTASSRDASIAGRQRGLRSSGKPSPWRWITPSASSLPM